MISLKKVKMRVKECFNENAFSYKNLNIVQKFLAFELALRIKEEKIIDLGCGEGSIYLSLKQKRKKIKSFLGVDFSPAMLALHPKAKEVKLLEADFNKKALFKRLKKYKNYAIISSSALQWAKDLDFTFRECAKLSKKGYFILFTSNTFKAIQKITNLASPIRAKKEILFAFKKNYYLKEQKVIKIYLKFNSTLDMLRYINKSGVSAGIRATPAQTFKLLREYPKNYLEFEAILIVGESKFALRRVRKRVDAIYR